MKKEKNKNKQNQLHQINMIIQTQKFVCVQYFDISKLIF